jgi:uroporphyrinogen-III decarboxylase
MDKNWAELTADERREERYERWLSPSGLTFVSPEAEKAYKERVTRFIKALKLEKPDRVPCLLPAALFPPYYAGISLKEAIYNYGELRRAWLKYLSEFEMDAYQGPGGILPGKVLENLDFKLYQWPGHGLSAETRSFQYVEGENMKADEYDALIRDPSDFWIRVFIPRIFGRLRPFQKLSSFTSFIENPTPSLAPFAEPDIQAALQALIEAGKDLKSWLEVVDEVRQTALEAGYPCFWSGFAKAPFDTLGDTLRGSQGIILDMYRQPGQLKEAMEKLTPLTIRSAVDSAKSARTPLVMMPLHKGADGFMSGRQFETFYWPTLKKVVLGIVEEGLVPVLFAEGSYDTRLEIVKDLPRAATVWYFDQTDMVRAKKVLGGNACLTGNVPAALMCTGSALEVKQYCRWLIDVCGGNGGYILTGGAAVDKCDPDNLRAMMEAVKEYGVYR